MFAKFQLPRHLARASTKELLSKTAQLTRASFEGMSEEAIEENENLLDAIYDEIREREHCLEDPSAGAAFGHFPP